MSDETDAAVKLAERIEVLLADVAHATGRSVEVLRRALASAVRVEGAVIVGATDLILAKCKRP